VRRACSISRRTHFGLRTVAVPQVSAAELSDEMAWRFFGRDPVVRQSAERDPRIAGQLPERLGDLIVPPEERAHLLERELAVRRFAEFPAAIASTLEIAERCGTVVDSRSRAQIPRPEFYAWCRCRELYLERRHSSARVRAMVICRARSRID
jgi:hypothetical protein